MTPSGNVVDCCRVLFVKDGERLYDSGFRPIKDGAGWVEKETLVVIEDHGRWSVVVCENALLDSALFRLYLYRDSEQMVFTKVYEETISESISEEPTVTQRLLGTYRTIPYYGSGVTVWKINENR